MLGTQKLLSLRLYLNAATQNIHTFAKKDSLNGVLSLDHDL